MCLILIAWKVHPDLPLVVAANRDEFFSRPTAPLHQWENGICAGKDSLAGGTWLGWQEQGQRFAALTNFREPNKTVVERSRGALVCDFLLANTPPAQWLTQQDWSAYAGCNLLLSDGETLCYHSNRQGGSRVLAPGIYAISNAYLDTPWPKLRRAKAMFTAVLTKSEQQRSSPDIAALFALLQDRQLATDAELPNTGVPVAWEKCLSAIYIRAPEYDYGTRSSSVLICGKQGLLHYEERQFSLIEEENGRIVLDAVFDAFNSASCK